MNKGEMTVTLPKKWQGTLKSILEGKGREFLTGDREDTEAGETTREAWRENARQCFALAAQLKR